MNPDLIIVRYGELMLKGRNRARFERQIYGQLKRLLAPFESLSHREEFGRIYVELNGEPYERVVQGLDQVFGIHSYSPAYISELDLQEIQQKAVAVIRALNPQPKSFKVSVKRTNRNFPYDTPALLPLIGGAVLSRIDGMTVDVHKPECELKVEIRAEGAFMFTRTFKGAGGFPLGTNGKAMLMLSGGIDSPVAGWLAMRKGLELEAVHFHSYPYTSERAKQKVIDLARRLSVYSGRLKLHLVPFTSIQTKLRDSVQENLLITLMRRAMLRITERLAERSNALGIVTGESLGQVASQTLSSMNTIGQAAQLPLVRPLVAFDKDDIIKMAERIETYPISILPYEDCCTLFVPKSPSTNPNPERVRRIEEQLEWLEEEIQRAVENSERMLLRPTEDELDNYF